jgi:hypothetical protein
MSADGVKKFLAAIDLVFPAPQFDGDKMRQAAWQQLMATTLGGTDDHVLAETAATILRTRNPKKDGRFFPTPQECLEAVQEVAAKMERQRTPLLEHKAQDVPYDARTALARDLMQAPLGRQAHREGWDTTMFHFCVEQMRAPQGKEIDACKAEARAFAAARDKLAKGDHPLAGPWADYAAKMVAKARELMGEKAA